MNEYRDNRTVGRRLLAIYKNRKALQRAREQLAEDSAEFMKHLPRPLFNLPAIPDDCLPVTPPSVSYAAEDRFDFLHCSPADEIRAHGMGVALHL